VSGDEQVGGLLGIGRWVNKCYSASSVSGNDLVGGLIGEERVSIEVTNSFWDDTIGPASSAGGTGKSTSEMKDIDTFTDTETTGLDEAWDFDTVWDISTSYPFFKISTPPSGVVVSVKLGGVVVEKPLMVKVGGVVQEASGLMVG